MFRRLENNFKTRLLLSALDFFFPFSDYKVFTYEEENHVLCGMGVWPGIARFSCWNGGKSEEKGRTPLSETVRGLHLSLELLYLVMVTAILSPLS